ncbi:SUKH-4 family immunity protein [Streptomyces sp. NPDC006551]|uniref:SUKH-4 family immunity protein n=1 Tax=Streptomyces sp. NPDC006551 TaxID=3157178 RepID=UPI0033B22123
MERTVGSEDIIRLFGLQGIVLFPYEAGTDPSRLPRSLRVLHEVGLPHDDLFLSRMDVKDPEADPVLLGEFLTRHGRRYAPEAEKWLVLGYFQDSLLALDPDSGQVFAFPEGTSDHLLIHRDVESLIRALCVLQQYCSDRDDSDDEEALADSARAEIESFDPLPFTDPRSEWTIIFDEIAEGTW